METPKLPEKQSSLVVVPQPLEIVVAEDGGTPLTLILPPFEDINEIEGLKCLNFSLSEHVDLDHTQFQSSFSQDFDRLKVKEDRFGDSPIFASRLATLARFAGRHSLEWDMITRAYELSKDPFYAHRYGEGLIANHKHNEAEAFFGALDLGTDIAANLRLAYFCVQRRDLDRADKFIEVALNIDPLDYSARLFEGGLHLARQNYPRAIQSLRQALKERPSSTVTHCNIALAYAGMRDNAKALTSLKKAVALDPLNVNALCFLADISFGLERDEEALPSLRYYVQFEQKNVSVWSRLARSSFRLGRIDEAVEALKRQASLENSGGVWNNLGVAYQRLAQKRKALECYTHGLRIDQSEKNKSYFLTSRNLAQLLSSEENFDAVLEIVPGILAEDDGGIVARDEQLSDLVSMYIHALYREGRHTMAESLVHKYLALDAIADTLSVWLVGVLVGYQALRGEFDEVASLATEIDFKVERITSRNHAARESYINNVAFAFAEMGNIESAERYLSKIIHCVHKVAYPTATFGLIQFRKGRLDRAISLYEEAIGLAQTRRDKARIRQKLNLELGMYYTKENEAKARRWLTKVISERDGESVLARQADAIVRRLSHRND